MFLYILGVSWTKDSLHGVGYCEFMGGWIPVLNMHLKYLLTTGGKMSQSFIAPN